MNDFRESLMAGKRRMSPFSVMYRAQAPILIE